MKSAKRPPEIDAFLTSLDEAFQKTRKKTVPLYPYNKQTNTIVLPLEIEQTLRDLVLTGKKIEAVKRVTQLTGAGLRVSKDYVDNLALDHKRTSR
jgi:ribosomal protein L7/L12